MKVYRADRKKWDRGIHVEKGSESYWLDPQPSQKLRNHSPDGFEWGYGGSGPAQLALAILLDFTGNDETALLFYQDFKSQFISSARADGFTINESTIRAWFELLGSIGGPL